MDKKFEIVNQEVAYQGFFRMEKLRLKHTLFAGGWGQEISREYFVRSACVAVLLYDPYLDNVVLIEQFRVGALLKPERAWLVEIVAGAIEPGETAEQVAYRESLEEAGCTIEDLIVINEFYTTPGCSAERITLYCGKVDSSTACGIHGLDEEGEDILVKTVSFVEAMQMLEDGTLESAIPIIALQWLALNKNKLLEKWGIN